MRYQQHRPRVASNALNFTMLNRLRKPWFVYRPSQIARRIAFAITPQSRGYRPLRTAWGGIVWADPTRTIGRSISTTGVFDLAVSEAITRLATRGTLAVDVGANVGYMTLLAALAVGSTGRVVAFEPMPTLFSQLQRSAQGCLNSGEFAVIEPEPLALSDRDGCAWLRAPFGFEANDGLARIVDSEPNSADDIEVTTTTLDRRFPSESIELLKIDVEGHEAAVLAGAREMLANHRVRHIVFEEHDPLCSKVFALLSAHGYKLMSLDWELAGPLATPLASNKRHRAYESPNFIATIAPETVLSQFAMREWKCLHTISHNK